MGIPRSAIKLLMREGHQRCFYGSVLTLGKQHIYACGKDLIKWSDEMAFDLKNKDGIMLKHGENLNYEDLFHSLGFKTVESMDIDDYQGCSILHDLNKDVPNELYNKYDLIYDGGTSEHIFNFPKVLENCFKMLKEGGRIIHLLPTSNYIDHGFYMFSPTVFYDYYSSNKYSISGCFLLKLPRDNSLPNEPLWDIYEYLPGCLDIYRDRGIIRGQYGVWISAQKTKDTMIYNSIEQGRYLHEWNKYSQERKNSPNKNGTVGPFKAWLREFLLNNKLASKAPVSVFLDRVARY
ncbi:class I SAM-dependent methyltransferase [Candidatus Margulisiibacteriota bacterium]